MSENNNNVITQETAEVNPADIHKKRREIIKTILIIFLAVLLVLTFFSNTIMNKSLSEVATEVCTSGSLTEKLRGSGVLESNQSYEVKVKDNKKVEKIHIKSGQTIEKGTVLFTLSAEKSEQIKEAEKALNALKLEYESALLTVPKDYANENMQIKAAREDLQTLITKRDKAASQESVLADKKASLNNVNTQLKMKNNELAKYQGYVSAIDSEDYSMLPAEYSGSFVNQANTVSDNESKLYSAKAELESLKESGAGEADIKNAQNKVSSLQSAYDSALKQLNSAKNSARAKLSETLGNIQSEADSLTEQAASLENEIASMEAASYSELCDAVTAKQRELETLLLQLESTKKEDNVAQQKENLTLNNQKEEIENQTKELEKLKKDLGETEVKSEYSGVVSEILVNPGDTTLPDTALAVVDISSEGYTLTITADTEKVKKVKKGVEADIINNWSGDLKATLKDIKNDTSSGSKSKILTFNVEGNVESGQSIEISIPCSTAKYDAIVPKSAVYEDKNGKFVMSVKSKSSPLGNRYYAERINVEVLASDEVTSAVSGMISNGDYIISTASKPVKPGDQVRMKD